MSLITRCPACGTMFKVVPDQLRISEGWVRCGHCADVFDASAHLQREAVPPEAAVTKTPTSPGAPASVALPVETGVDSEVFASSLNTVIEDGVAFDEPDSSQLGAEAQALVEHPLDQPFELRRRDDGEVEVSRPARIRREPDTEGDSDIDDDAAHELSFVRKPRRGGSSQRPTWRAALLFSAVALTILLVLQIAMQDRDRVAAAAPALRPWLARLCVPLNCTIGPPRHIDAIAIDSSSFNKLRGDAYRLNVTLRNQAAVEVAMPALELTLTDGQDQPLVRRVLVPSELGPGAGAIAAASEWSGSLALAVAANGIGARVVGYRLLAFYP
jgi:predicted Zn finger-like uncharacterized protein